MKVAVRYFTRGGNTKKVADAIAQAVGVEAQDLTSPLPEKVQILFLGNSVYAAGMDPAVKRFISENKDKIGMICNVSTAALLPSTYKQMEKVAAQNGVSLSPREFHCRGSFSLMHRGHPDKADLEAAKRFALQVVDG